MKRTIKKFVHIILSGLLTVVFIASLQAQEQAAAFVYSDIDYLWNLDKGDEAGVLADVAYIRSAPNTHATLLDSLLQGEKVIILSESSVGQSTIRGFIAPWYEVSYSKNNTRKKGYIWLGLLALGGGSDKQGHDFIYGFLRKPAVPDQQPETFTGILKVLDASKKLITQAEFPVAYSGQIVSESKLLPDMGLQGVKHIIRIAFLSEGCGVPTEYYYMAWTGTTLIPLPSRYTVADAGIFYHEESILFPNEHQGAKDLILKNIVTGYLEDPNDENSALKEEKKQVQYRWEGTHYAEIIYLK